MICKKCHMNIDGDCMLITGECVFCYYHVSDWDSNGQLVTKQEAINDRCPNCLRKIPNQEFIYKHGCKWCIGEYYDKTNSK